MILKFFKYIALLLILMLIACSDQQESIEEISVTDYQSAVSFMYTNYNNQTAFNLRTKVHWFEDHSGIWFIDHSKNGRSYKTLNFDDQTIQQLVDQDRLMTAINKIKIERIEEDEVILTNFRKINDGLSFDLQDESYQVHLGTYEVQKLEKLDKQFSQTNPFESISPDGQWKAYVQDYNLFIESLTTGKKHQLSKDGKKDYEIASAYGWFDKMYGENGKRPQHFSVNWSDDSKWISTNIIDTRNAEKMYLLDWGKEQRFKPELVSYYRGSPGDTTMVLSTPVFYNIETKKLVKTDLPTHTHINAVNSQWQKESGKVIADVFQRGFQKRELIEVDLNTERSKTLITETSETNIDNFEYRYLKRLNKIIFLSERSGWRQLYAYDLDSQETSILTSDSYYINSLERVDEDQKMIYFLASGKNPQSNPYHQQLYKVTLEGKETLLTPELKHHQIEFSPDGNYFTDNISTIDTPTSTVLRESSHGNIIRELTQADISLAVDKGFVLPEPFSLTAKDGQTTIYGAFWKPTNFDASKKYPIIDATYTGPHTQMFPKSFDGVFSQQSLAELGFVVVKIDGLGTSGRSKAFHNHSYKNMGNNLEDHVLAIKHLAAQHSWIDIEKVGIYGHSAGGYDTGRAMLAFPDFYKVGVASSADHDFRMEKAHWPEMYQGWPVDSTYHQVSNITNASNLKGKLLLVHGGLDDNVNPSATFKLSEALVNADKDFDLLIFPSQRHGYRGKARNYFTKKRWNYFVEHLQERAPIWDFNWE